MLMQPSGKYLDVQTFEAQDLSVIDLIYGASNLRRYTGAADCTVLQHSWNCDLIAKSLGLSPRARYFCFIHDLHEAICGDVSSPMKAAVPEFREFENVVQAKVLERLGVTDWKENLVKPVDLLALRAEAKFYFGELTGDWPGVPFGYSDYEGELYTETPSIERSVYHLTYLRRDYEKQKDKENR